MVSRQSPSLHFTNHKVLSSPGTVIKIHEPVGVIGIACPDTSPLLSFVSLVGAAVARSNSVVVVPSEKYPLLALDMYQVNGKFHLYHEPDILH